MNTDKRIPTPDDIRLFLTDVDGTLTDGGMYYGSDGTEFKKFNTRDGMGLQLLQRTGVQVGIVNYAEQSEGIQLGLVNIMPEGRYPVMPIFNLGF